MFGVRPHLEFSTQAWAPWTKGDKLVLEQEQVQKKAVAMVSGLTGRDYEERLVELGLLTLSLMHKVMHGIGGLDHDVWFEKASESVRVTRVAADGLNVKVKNGGLELRRNFFSVRASSQWNAVTDIKRMKRSYMRHRAPEARMPVA